MSEPKRIALVGGGVRSGKSAFALRLAERLGKRRAFIATAAINDGEMAERAERHLRERAGRFQTFEEPVDLPGRLASLSDFDVVVIDCLTLWLSQRLVDDVPVERILTEVDRLVESLSERRMHAIVVTNEVGMSVHPETALGRRFQDLAGWSHQRLSRACDEIYLAVLGTILRVRPGGPFLEES
jgi:adenosylcobinamide kinase/adenosylcobinamide-phosphate guanylyltransferase